MTEPHAIAYAALRVRVTQLVEACDQSAFDVPAPATPGWRARDVLAHMVGVSDDVVHGRLDGIATDAWTAAQVDGRQATPVGEMLAEWERSGPGFERLLADAPEEIAGQARFDAATHEHDLRHAVGLAGARDSSAMGVGWEWLIASRTRLAAPAVTFVTERGADVAGVGEPRATVRAPFFELFRAVTGRRTADEIAGYEWEPAPDPASILAATFFTIRADSLRE
jgi:hypothetical protein